MRTSTWIAFWSLHGIVGKRRYTNFRNWVMGCFVHPTSLDPEGRSVFLCMCPCLSVYICVNACAYMRVYVYINIHVHTHVSLCVHVCVYVHACICFVCLCMYTYVPGCVDTIWHEYLHVLLISHDWFVTATSSHAAILSITQQVLFQTNPTATSIGPWVTYGEQDKDEDEERNRA
jgi:hypothetical protein